MAKKSGKEPPDPTSKLALTAIVLLVLGTMGTSIVNEQERQGHPPIIPRIDRSSTNQYSQPPRRVQAPPCKLARTRPEREYTFWDYFKGWGEKPLHVGTKNITPFGCEVTASPPGHAVPGGYPYRPGH